MDEMNVRELLKCTVTGDIPIEYSSFLKLCGADLIVVYVCQLKDGYMLGYSHKEKCFYKIHTGYPYPDLPMPQIDFIVEILNVFSSYGLCVLPIYDIVVKKFSEAISIFNDNDTTDLRMFVQSFDCRYLIKESAVSGIIENRGIEKNVTGLSIIYKSNYAIILLVTDEKLAKLSLKSGAMIECYFKNGLVIQRGSIIVLNLDDKLTNTEVLEVINKILDSSIDIDYSLNFQPDALTLFNWYCNVGLTSFNNRKTIYSNKESRSEVLSVFINKIVFPVLSHELLLKPSFILLQSCDFVEFVNSKLLKLRSSLDLRNALMYLFKSDSDYNKHHEIVEDNLNRDVAVYLFVHIVAYYDDLYSDCLSKEEFRQYCCEYLIDLICIAASTYINKFIDVHSVYLLRNGVRYESVNNFCGYGVTNNEVWNVDLPDDFCQPRSIEKRVPPFMELHLAGDLTVSLIHKYYDDVPSYICDSLSKIYLYKTVYNYRRIDDRNHSSFNRVTTKRTDFSLDKFMQYFDNHTKTALAIDINALSHLKTILSSSIFNIVLVSGKDSEYYTDDMWFLLTWFNTEHLFRNQRANSSTERLVKRSGYYLYQLRLSGYVRELKLSNKSILNLNVDTNVLERSREFLFSILLYIMFVSDTLKTEFDGKFRNLTVKDIDMNVNQFKYTVKDNGHVVLSIRL